MATTEQYVIFTHHGKTMIGKFYESVPTAVSADGGVHATYGYNSSSYFVANPCEIVFELKVPASGSADLNWTLKPVYYHDLVSSTDSNYNEIIVTYPKSEVGLSNIGGSAVINGVLLDAYKELCE